MWTKNIACHISKTKNVVALKSTATAATPHGEW